MSTAYIKLWNDMQPYMLEFSKDNISQQHQEKTEN